MRLIAPSNAAFIGVPETRSFTPLRLPASTEGKSASVRLASIGASRQMNRPVAPKLLEIEGHASENSTPDRVSVILRASSRIAMVPPSMRISENAASRCAADWLRVSASINPDQLDWPFGFNSTEIFGRSSVTSAISTRPISRGKNRRRAVKRSATSAGCLASPRITSSKLTLPVGNSETLAFPRRTGSSPVTPRISPRTCWRTVSAEIRYPAVVRTSSPPAITASRIIPRRFKPVAAVNWRFPVASASSAGGL